MDSKPYRSHRCLLIQTLYSLSPHFRPNFFCWIAHLNYRIFIYKYCHYFLHYLSSIALGRQLTKRYSIYGVITRYSMTNVIIVR